MAPKRRLKEQTCFSLWNGSVTITDIISLNCLNFRHPSPTPVKQMIPKLILASIVRMVLVLVPSAVFFFFCKIYFPLMLRLLCLKCDVALKMYRDRRWCATRNTTHLCLFLDILVAGSPPVVASSWHPSAAGSNPSTFNPNVLFLDKVECANVVLRQRQDHKVSNQCERVIEEKKWIGCVCPVHTHRAMTSSHRWVSIRGPLGVGEKIASVLAGWENWHCWFCALMILEPSRLFFYNTV